MLRCSIQHNQAIFAITRVFWWGRDFFGPYFCCERHKFNYVFNLLLQRKNERVQLIKGIREINTADGEVSPTKESLKAKLLDFERKMQFLYEGTSYNGNTLFCFCFSPLNDYVGLQQFFFGLREVFSIERERSSRGSGQIFAR